MRPSISQLIVVVAVIVVPLLGHPTDATGVKFLPSSPPMGKAFHQLSQQHAQPVQQLPLLSRRTIINTASCNGFLDINFSDHLTMAVDESMEGPKQVVARATAEHELVIQKQ